LHPSERIARALHLAFGSTQLFGLGRREIRLRARHVERDANIGRHRALALDRHSHRAVVHRQRKTDHAHLRHGLLRQRGHALHERARSIHGHRVDATRQLHCGASCQKVAKTQWSTEQSATDRRFARAPSRRFYS
jgi:hypothetical protein